MVEKTCYERHEYIRWGALVVKILIFLFHLKFHSHIHVILWTSFYFLDPKAWNRFVTLKSLLNMMLRVTSVLVYEVGMTINICIHFRQMNCCWVVERSQPLKHVSLDLYLKCSGPHPWCRRSFLKYRTLHSIQQR